MLILSEQKLDLGMVKFGKPTIFGFSVTNTGTEDVTINSVQGGCSSCTTAKINRTTIPAGQSATVDAVFTPGTLGKQNKIIAIKWNSTNVLTFNFVAESYE